jgi:DEAD/DEAH box helicase domain-containing protein
VLDDSWPKCILPSFPLYSHQVTGLGYVQNGHHVMISSKTSSGKSLIYQLPILKGIKESDEFRALLIFPTKVFDFY